jgi:hypothetical protein
MGMLEFVTEPSATVVLLVCAGSLVTPHNKRRVKMQRISLFITLIIGDVMFYAAKIHFFLAHPITKKNFTP